MPTQAEIELQRRKDSASSMKNSNTVIAEQEGMQQEMENHAEFLRKDSEQQAAALDDLINQQRIEVEKAEAEALEAIAKMAEQK